MRRFLVGLGKLIGVVLRASIVVLLFLCLTNMAWLELNYFTKYEVAHDVVLREHERQLVVGEILNSQESWERAADTMRVSFLEARAERLELERQLWITQSEMYHFMQTLKRVDPEALDATLDEMVEPEVWNPFMLPDWDENNPYEKD